MKARRIDRAALEARMRGMDYEPSVIVECWAVMKEILAALRSAPTS